MRFALLVMIAVASGAVGMTAMQTLLPGNASMFEAVRALGGSMANFQLADINPVKAYWDVRKQITSGDGRYAQIRRQPNPAPAIHRAADQAIPVQA
jgi:hypothetical protein